MEYKKQTREVQYKGRQVDNPGKRLAQENKAYKARDAGMMREWDQRSREYGAALQEWNQNLAAKDKEVVDFWKTVTPAATKLLSETIPDAMKLKAEADDENAIQTFRDLPLAEQNKIRDQARLLFKESDGLYDRRADLEAEANRLGYTEYANLLGKLNKRGDTRIYRELISGELNNYEQGLKNALASTDQKYIHDGVAFSGSEVGNDLTRLEIVLKAEEADFYKRVQVGGINTKIITAFADETLQEVGQRIARTEGNRITVASAKAETQQIIASIGTDLDFSLGWTREDGYGFKLTSDGKIPPEVEQNLGSILKKLEKQSILAGETDSVNKARDRFAAGLREWADRQKDPKSARDFVNELLGANGVEANTLKLSNGATFRDIDVLRFGPNGSWSQSTNSIGGSINEEILNAQDRLDNTGMWVPVDKDGVKRSADWLKKNPLIQKDGSLNTAWQNTWQYKLVEASRNPEINLDDVKEKAIKEMNDKGIYDVSVLAQVRNWSPPKSPKTTITFIKQLQKEKSSLIVGNQIARKDLEGYDLQPETIKQIEELGITIVDNTVGALDNGRLNAETIILEQLKNTPGGFTAGKEAILDSIMEEAIALVQADQNRTPQNENELLAKTVKNLLDNEFVAAQEQRGHAWYLNEDGQAVNQFRHGWVPFSNVPAERLKQKLEAETRLNTYTLKKADLSNGPASKQVDFWDKGTLTGIVKQYNEKGYIDFSVLNTTAIAGEDPIEAINNQIQKHGLDIPLLVKNETYQAFTTAFSHGDIQTIYKLNGNKGSKTPSITAARIINDKVDRMLESNGQGFWDLSPSGVRMPNQQSIEATLMQSFDGDVNTNKDGRLGLYGIPIEEARRIVGPNFKLEDFLGNKELQEQTIRTFISEESVRNYDLIKGKVFRTVGKRRSTGFGSSIVVRNMLHTLTTGDRQDSIWNDKKVLSQRIDDTGLETFNNNTRLLQIYTGNYNGGFVPSKDNPKYFNRFGY